jgi:hypothetical protein
MARAPKLKVYRTPIGFHDAYVAAPSQKAALEAWGADANLFARGVAEIVTDASLSEEPLARPGEVVKRLRGTAAEHLAALPPDEPVPRRKQGTTKTVAPRSRRRVAAAKKPPPPKPRPDRSELDAAERTLEDTRRRLDEGLSDLRKREAELQKERRDAERRREAEIGKLTDEMERARAAYALAMRKWRA